LDDFSDREQPSAAPLLERLVGSVFGDGDVEVLEPTAGLFKDKIVLTREVPVGGTPRDAGRLGDVVHRGLDEAVLDEQGDCGVGDCGSGLLVSSFDQSWHVM
jgi:hypothetical protein